MVPWSRCLRCLPAMALVLLLALGTTGTALADQNDPALDGLFRDLKAAQSPQLVRQIEAQIWARWFETGSEETDRMLRAGDIALARGQYNHSYALLNGVIELRPDLSEGWNRRATLRYLMGDYEGSIADIDETLAREPRHFGALSGLGCRGTKVIANPEDAGKKAEEGGRSRGWRRFRGLAGRTKVFANPARKGP